MSESFDLTGPDNFVAGTIGEPGERIFFLQARQGPEIVTLKLEKGQIQAIASSLADIIETFEFDDDELVDGKLESVPPTEMHEPVMAAWTVGDLGLGIDEAGHRVVVMAEELPDDDDSESGAAARFHLTAGQAQGFVDHALFLLEYGRDFGRQNGHRKIGE
ncbi:MAG: putative repeat protein (TIGR03847 family) [Candidatus Poriferisodalaceae bacterium]|jgi:uncharacterized repeat protein (TIGR03847 family)